MINILHLNKAYYPHIGGIEKVVQDLAENVNKSEFKCEVLVCNTPGKGALIELINNINVIRSKTISYFKSSPISTNYIREAMGSFHKYDIIHLHEPFPLGSIICWLIPRQSKLIVTWHSDVIRQKMLKWFLLPFQWLTLCRADQIIATSERMKHNSFVRRFKNKVKVLHLSISDENLLKNNNEGRYFLFIGRFVYYKGLMDLVEAAKYVNIPIKLVGNGPLWNDVESRIISDNLNHIDLIKGPVKRETLTSYFRGAIALVFPSNAPSEAFGLVQLEAMAACKPVINTYLNTGVPEVSIDGFTGITVKPNSPIELAQAMQKIWDDKGLRSKLGANAKDRVEKCFVHSVTIPQIEKLYKDLVSSVK